jgi:general secretion pathway protein G
MNPSPPTLKSRLRAVPGFTLIELVLVLTIIAILAGSGIYLLSGNVDTAKETRVEGDLNALATQLQLYEARCQRLPTTDQGLDALVIKPTKDPIPDRWTALLQEQMKDPWGQPYKYRYPAQKSKKAYDIWSVGKDGVDGNEDDIGNWKSTEKK